MESNREKWFLLILYLVSLTVRIIYFFEYKSMLEFFHPTVDSLFAHTAAKAIAAGALTAPEPFFRAPFYNYFLGLIYFLSGDSIAAARLVQLVIGSFTPILIYTIAVNLFNRRVAVVASLLALLCSDIVHFEGELLVDSIMMTLTLLIFLACIKYSATSKNIWLYLAGILTGIAGITRPNSLVLAACVVYLLYVLKMPVNLSSWGKSVTRYALALAIPLLIVLGHNLTRREPAFAIATQGGINFYIGNNAKADGVSAVMPDKLGFNWQYQDIRYQAEQDRKRSLTPSEVSSYYYSKGWGDIFGNPLHWIELGIKKVYLFFSGADISNNFDLIAFKKQFWILRLLPIGMGILAPLGLIGIAMSFKSSAAARGLAAFIALYMLSFVFYFVNSRFRLPVLGTLAIFSGITLLAWYDDFKARRIPNLVISVLATGILILISNANLYRLDFDNQQQFYYSRGNLLLESADYQGAIANFRRSLGLGVPLSQTYLNIGAAFLKDRRPDSARVYFTLEDSLSGGDAESANNLAYMYRQSKQTPEAIASAKRALSVKPYLEEARLNLWNAFREGGEFDSAYESINDYKKEHELTVRENFIFAIICSDLQKFDESLVTFHVVLDQIQRLRQPRYEDITGTTFSGVSYNSEVFKGKVLYNMGFVFGAKSETDSALVYLRKAVEANPNLVEGWINLGSANFAKKNFADAKTAYLRAARLNPKNALLVYNLALVSLSTNDTTSARNYLQQCLAIDAGFSPARSLAAAIGKNQ